MPWSNGQFSRTDGVFNGREVWKQYSATRQNVLADRFDTHDQDIADGINLALAKDGSNSATANIPMGGFKFTNVGPSVANNEYFTREQAFAAAWITFQQFANRGIGEAKLDTTTPAGETPARGSIMTWDADAMKMSFVPPDTLIASVAQPGQVSGTFNAIGSFCFAGNRISRLTGLSTGGTFSGSNLYPAGFNGNGVHFYTAGGTLSGTWRLLGTQPNFFSPNSNFASVFFRVS